MKETVAARRESTSDFYGSVEDYAFVSADDMDERRKVSQATRKEGSVFRM